MGSEKFIRKCIKVMGRQGHQHAGSPEDSSDPRTRDKQHGRVSERGIGGPNGGSVVYFYTYLRMEELWRDKPEAMLSGKR